MHGALAAGGPPRIARSGGDTLCWSYARPEPRASREALSFLAGALTGVHASRSRGALYVVQTERFSSQESKKDKKRRKTNDDIAQPLDLA